MNQTSRSITFKKIILVFLASCGLALVTAVAWWVIIFQIGAARDPQNELPGYVASLFGGPLGLLLGFVGGLIAGFLRRRPRALVRYLLVSFLLCIPAVLIGVFVR